MKKKKNDITIKKVGDRKIVKLRGGRPDQVIKDKTKYNRKVKHKKKDPV